MWACREPARVKRQVQGSLSYCTEARLRGLQGQDLRVISARGSNVLEIYGKGEQQEELEKYAKELNISDNVKFRGQKANVQTYIAVSYTHLTYYGGRVLHQP